MSTLSVGEAAPEFELQDDSGSAVKLSDYLGKKVILYFYPRSFTSGCTVEACNFRDDFSLYKNMDAVILGVSPDEVDDQNRFRSEYELPFTLLADPDHRVASLYGAWGRKPWGEGVLRKTFVIDEGGRIEKIYGRVDPKIHSAQLLEYLNPS